MVFQLEDPCSVRPEVQASSSMTNEPNPHFNTKFDFAMISATSTLRVHVYDKKSTMQNVMAHPVKTLTGNITGELVHCFSEVTAPIEALLVREGGGDAHQ